MSFERNWLIGNAISAIAAVFTAKSSLAKDNYHIYIYQVFQCALLAVASIFFDSYAGIVTLVICAIRNYMLSKGKFGIKACVITSVLLLVLGLVVNNRGYLGYIVIAANLIYTFGTFITKREITIKINIFIDIALWVIYEVLILDIPSLIADVIALVITFVAIVRCVISQRTAKEIG